MEFVLMRLLIVQLRSTIYGADRADLQIPKLRKPLPTAFKPTAVGFDPFMHYSVRLDVAPLGKPSAAEVTGVWTLPSVTAFVCLQWVSSCAAVILE